MAIARTGDARANRVSHPTRFAAAIAAYKRARALGWKSPVSCLAFERITLRTGPLGYVCALLEHTL